MTAKHPWLRIDYEQCCINGAGSVCVCVRARVCIEWAKQKQGKDETFVKKGRRFRYNTKRTS